MDIRLGLVVRRRWWWNEWYKKYKELVFENIKHIDESGNEYWLAKKEQPNYQQKKEKWLIG